MREASALGKWRRVLWPKGTAVQKPGAGVSLRRRGGHVAEQSGASRGGGRKEERRLGGRGCRGGQAPGSREGEPVRSAGKFQNVRAEEGHRHTAPHTWTPRHAASGQRHPLLPPLGTPLVPHQETFASAWGQWPSAPSPARNQSFASGLDAVPSPPEASAYSSGWGEVVI